MSVMRVLKIPFVASAAFASGVAKVDQTLDLCAHALYNGVHFALPAFEKVADPASAPPSGKKRKSGQTASPPKSKVNFEVRALEPALVRTLEMWSACNRVFCCLLSACGISFIAHLWDCLCAIASSHSDGQQFGSVEFDLSLLAPALLFTVCLVSLFCCALRGVATIISSKSLVFAAAFAAGCVTAGLLTVPRGLVDFDLDAAHAALLRHFRHDAPAPDQTASDGARALFRGAMALVGGLCAAAHVWPSVRRAECCLNSGEEAERGPAGEDGPDLRSVKRQLIRTMGYQPQSLGTVVGAANLVFPVLFLAAWVPSFVQYLGWDAAAVAQARALLWTAAICSRIAIVRSCVRASLSPQIYFKGDLGKGRVVVLERVMLVNHLALQIIAPAGLQAALLLLYLRCASGDFSGFGLMPGIAAAFSDPASGVGAMVHRYIFAVSDGPGEAGLTQLVPDAFCCAVASWVACWCCFCEVVFFVVALGYWMLRGGRRE